MRPRATLPNTSLRRALVAQPVFLGAVLARSLFFLLCFSPRCRLRTALSSPRRAVVSAPRRSLPRAHLLHQAAIVQHVQLILRLFAVRGHVCDCRRLAARRPWPCWARAHAARLLGWTASVLGLLGPAGLGARLLGPTVAILTASVLACLAVPHPSHDICASAATTSLPLIS